MFGGLILVLLFFVLIIVVIILIISIIISKNKLRTTFKINIGILIFVLLFFFIWFPVKENTVLKLKNGYLVEIEDFEHTAYYLTNVGYLEGLKKEKNNWIGYIEETDSYKGKYGIKPETYFLINDNKIEYNLDEKTLEKRLGLKEIKLQDAEYFVDKFGSKKEILYQYQLDKTGDLDENISLNSELSKKLETKYKKDRAFYLMFWSVMLLMEIIYLFIKNRKITKSNKD